MSAYTATKGVGVCLGITFGLMMTFIGLIFYFTISEFMPIFEVFSLAFIVIGLFLFGYGVAKAPGARRETAKWKSVIEIAAVRKEVSISDICYETGLDSEYIRDVLTQCLINKYLFGYIEGDLFVRDTAGSSRYLGRPTGLFSAGDD